jgi:hypothetical protein
MPGQGEPGASVVPNANGEVAVDPLNTGVPHLLLHLNYDFCFRPGPEHVVGRDQLLLKFNVV